MKRPPPSAKRDDARGLLKKTGADVLIWGSVISSRRESAMRLFWTPARDVPDAKSTARYQAETIALPVEFWSDLKQILGFAMVAAEIASLEAAIVTAKRHVAAAEAAEVDEAERRKARDALALLDDFSQRGKLLDDAMGNFVRQYDELAHDFRELQLLGYEPTSYPLIQINMQAAVATKLQFTDLRQNFLAPHARRDFISVIEGWACHIRRRAEARLNRNAPGKKAA